MSASDVVATLLLVALIVFVIWAFALLIQSIQADNELTYRCIQTGYVSMLHLAGQTYCYRLSGESGELVRIK